MSLQIPAVIKLTAAGDIAVLAELLFFGQRVE